MMCYYTINSSDDDTVALTMICYYTRVDSDVIGGDDRNDNWNEALLLYLCSVRHR